MKTLNVVHLSDTHLCAEGKLLHGTIDAWARLRAALHAAKHFTPDVVVVTGDIADRGAPVHERAAKLFAKFENELGCPIIAVPGNHDPQESVNEAFNTFRLSTGPHIANTVHEIDGLRIIGLDSGGYREARGWLDAPQLRWLSSLLTQPAPRGSLILMHHPPVEAMAAELSGRGLANPEDLALILSGSDVRGILCGHFHQAGVGQLKGTNVFMAPATSYNTNAYAPQEILSGPESSWFSLLQVDAQSIRNSPIPVRHGTRKNKNQIASKTTNATRARIPAHSRETSS
ncbi:phosphoesterase [Arthrobacter sp. MYb211]|uniref:metallophosphoesterase family protein n=1 Tax=unclassified Arthrobacter TaxID=235627 RepID=UPI000CFAFEA9|nr:MULTISPECIES: metallophosphoesterase [unclassified Arthrobacter]PRA12328.1 phosphoesterase [Arthrobacter sp. MYb221]PRC08791.1 phosphoesterase [Arthrobacter sp. MYb211]